ncbi:MAG: hypothetical protein PHP99_09125 [Paludibacter sp.]|nr:hypothetical protein [Paludibacter sp.]
MKKVVLLSPFFLGVLVLMCVGFAGCTSGRPVQHTEPVTQADYLQVLKDSVQKLNMQVDKLTFMAATYETYLVAYENERIAKDDSIRLLTDSVNKLNARPLMTKAQFLDLYKYERLLKYYKICKARPVNWKYYKGWSTRVFEE